MIVVYLKNGEKAPMPDATRVKLETEAETGVKVLRCYFGDQDVGQFKWDEVAGYTIAASSSLEASPAAAFATWGVAREG